MAKIQTLTLLFLILAGLSTMNVQGQEENQKYGSFTDPRDGNTYRTVELAGQIWMAENIRYASDVISYSYERDTFG